MPIPTAALPGEEQGRNRERSRGKEGRKEGGKENGNGRTTENRGHYREMRE